MKEYKWGRLMISNQIGLMVSWGESVVPNRKYISLEIPFLIIQTLLGLGNSLQARQVLPTFEIHRLTFQPEPIKQYSPLLMAME